MNAIWAALIGVGGTVLGSTITFFVQRSVADEAARRGEVERARQERLDAYVAFLSIVLRFRGTEIDRWHCEHEDPDADSTRTARAEARTARAEAIAALSRVLLLAGGDELQRNATDCVDAVGRIHTADTAEERDERITHANFRIRWLSEAAGRDIGASRVELPQLGFS
ncbi:hypothetical protein [Nocardia sp. NPDC052316]|uniref:hypothetical protein n=1 Tax=Nocardia sp. NPDC052316 TaxID=3364329 RepID=UPI0037CC4874